MAEFRKIWFLCGTSAGNEALRFNLKPTA
jgi:hypothetical protein